MFIETNCKFITIFIPQTICKSSLQHFAIELLKENKTKTGTHYTYKNICASMAKKVHSMCILKKLVRQKRKIQK